MTTLATNAICTLILTYSANKAIKQTPINNRWLPLISLIIGTTIGSLVGVFYDPSNLMTNIVVGAFAGANSTWLDQFIKHTVMGGDK